MTLDSAPPMRRHPTILDVASHAGVSKSTVSNVVRGLPGVSEATRRRVRSSIRELGYRPNVLARQLVQQRTSILGVVVGDLANPFFAEMAKSVERHAAARGYTAMFCNTEGDSQSELAGIETLLEHRVAGIVFLAFSGDSRTMQETLQHQVPAVFVSCRAEWGDVVSVDDSFAEEGMAKGLLTPEQAANSPFLHSITNWVGPNAPERPPRRPNSSPEGPEGRGAVREPWSRTAPPRSP